MRKNRKNFDQVDKKLIFAIPLNTWNVKKIFPSNMKILNNSNSHINSYSNLGASFGGSPFKFGSNEAVSFLCGSMYFKVQDIEVFQLV